MNDGRRCARPSARSWLTLGLLLAALGCGAQDPDLPEQNATGLSELAINWSGVPTSDVALSSIWGGGGTLPIYRLVDDGTSFAASDGGGTFARSAPGAARAVLTLGYSGAPQTTAQSVVVNYQAWTILGGAGSVRVRLYSGSTLLGTAPARALTATRQNLSETFAGLAVSDPNLLRTEFEYSNSAGTGSLVMSLAWIDVAGADTQVPAVSDKLVPRSGAWFGAYARASAAINWDWARAMRDFEAKAGRKMDIVYRYHDWGSSNNGTFPDQWELAQMQAGYIVHVAWESRQYSAGRNLTWTEIKNGSQDAVIDAAISRVRNAPGKIMITFDHEMDNVDVHAADGPDADYVAAYRRIVDRFRAAGVTNVVWVWTPMGWSGTYARLPGLYPGDNYVDWLGYDPYNFYTCNRGAWKDTLTTFRAYYDWMHQPAQRAWHGAKPYIMNEYSSHEDSANPARKGDWMRGIPAAVKALPDLKAIQFFNSTTSLSGGFCNLLVDSTPQALAGFVEAGRDPYFNQPHQ